MLPLRRRRRRRYRERVSIGSSERVTSVYRDAVGGLHHLTEVQPDTLEIVALCRPPSPQWEEPTDRVDCVECMAWRLVEEVRVAVVRARIRWGPEVPLQLLFGAMTYETLLRSRVWSEHIGEQLLPLPGDLRLFGVEFSRTASAIAPYDWALIHPLAAGNLRE